MKIQRFLLAQLTQAIRPGKVLIVFSSRQAGKTTLVRNLLAASDLPRGCVSAGRYFFDSDSGLYATA